MRTDVILATGSRVKSLPGLEPGRPAHRHQRRRPADATRCRQHHRRRRGRRRRRVRELLPRRRGRRDRCSSTCRASCRSRTREVSQGARAHVPPARDEGDHRRPLRSGVRDGRRDGRVPDGRQGRRGAQGGPRRADARRRRAARQHRTTWVSRSTRAKVEKGFVQVDGRMRTAEPHLYAIGDVIGGLLLAHVAAHEGITAVHTIAGAEPSRRLPQDAARHLLAAADRVDRPDAGRMRAAKASPSRSASSRSRPIGKALIGGEYEGFVQGHRRQGDRRDRWAST